MKLKSLPKFLAVLTLLVQFIMIPKMSYAETAATNERTELKDGGKYNLVTALNDRSVIGILGGNNFVRLTNELGGLSYCRWELKYSPEKQAYKLQANLNYQTFALSWRNVDGLDKALGVANANSNDEHYWILEPYDVAKGYYYIKNKKSSKYLDVRGKSTANNTDIIVYDFNNGWNQIFKLREVN